MNIEFDQDLLKQVTEGKTYAGYCKITIVNGCPSSWNCIIIAAGVKFFNTDSTEYTEGAREVYLSYGQSSTFDSNDHSKCVSQAQVFIQAKVGSQPPAVFQGVIGTKPGECLLSGTMTLAPKQSIDKDLKKELTFANMLELVQN